MARGRPNARPACSAPSIGHSLIVGGLDRPAFLYGLGPNASQLGASFSVRCCPIFRARSGLSANLSGRCSAFTISPCVGLEIVSYPA